MKTKNHVHNIIFCGTGGQGVLKASEVAAIAAMTAGFRVKKSEVHGMAQRGGSVESHLRFGNSVSSPLIMPGQADFLVALQADEGKRMKGFLKEGGADLSSYLDEAAKLPNSRFVNTFLLGILATKLPISVEHWHNALEMVVAKRIEENKAIFEQGFKLGKGSVSSG